ncbi:nuclear transport factor 2 family protein, partial [Rhodococcus koreensis]
MADTATRADVQDAIDALIRAFGEHDTTAYFSSFSPDATFVFYTHPEPLPSREAYRDLWTEWESDGFRVLACRSSEQNV